MNGFKKTTGNEVKTNARNICHNNQWCKIWASWCLTQSLCHYPI